MASESFKLDTPGTYTFLTGAALPLKEPQPIRETGNIFAPTEFYKTRKGYTRNGGPYFPPESTMVQVNIDMGNIQLLFDDQSFYQQYILGKLETSKHYETLGINSGKRYSPGELADTIKRHRYLFENKEEAMRLVADLRNFKAEATIKTEVQKDDRAGRRNLFEVAVKTDAPTEFVILLNPHKGTEPKKFKVEICLEQKGQVTECYLESPEMSDYIETEKAQLFKDLLAPFTADGIAIIYE